MKVHERNEKIWEHMKSDCSKCSGLCCNALYFSKIDGFPKDKVAGKPCIHLLEDFKCKVHSQLEKQKLKGCIGYDCFGTGQHVTQVIYQGKTYKDLPNESSEIFDVFVIVFQLYQIRYYLIEASTLIVALPLNNTIQDLIEENIKMSNVSPDVILSLDIEEYRQRVNDILHQACKLLQQSIPNQKKNVPTNFLGGNFKGVDMSGVDLSTKLLIAANYEKCLFDGTILLGADTRDTNFSDADLSEAVFLTQGQVNSAKGNRNTILPYHLEYPPTWK